MLYLLDSYTDTSKWNGTPLHEATSAVVKEELNGDFTLTVKYPITDTGIYRLIKEDMLIKAPVPQLQPQLFRIKKPVENDDTIEIEAYHITEDVMQRSISAFNVSEQTCATALSRMVQQSKSPLGGFAFVSDITGSESFAIEKDETLYTVLLGGDTSIVSAWGGEVTRDNFVITVNKNRGADRGAIISTHRNLNSYKRTKASNGVVTRVHARSKFRLEKDDNGKLEAVPKGAQATGVEEDEYTISVTVDSPLINNYPYINELEVENNELKSVEELKKWAETKFSVEHVDEISDSIEIEAYEIDGQEIHLGDIVNIKSWKHDIDVYKKAIAYEFDCLADNGNGSYISITFDDKAPVGIGGSRSSSGVSGLAKTISDTVTGSVQKIDIAAALANADAAFDAVFERQKETIENGIEQAKAEAEVKIAETQQTFNDKLAEMEATLANSKVDEAQIQAILDKSTAGLSDELKEDARKLIDQAKLEADGKLNQAKLDITDQIKSEVTKVEGKIPAMSAGRNLFPNSRFKRDLSRPYGAWRNEYGKEIVNWDQSSGQLSESIDTTEKFQGDNTLKLVSTWNGKVENQKWTVTLNNNNNNNNVSQGRNQDLVISFYAKTTKPGSKIIVRAGFRGAEFSTEPLTADWAFYSIHYIKKQNTDATMEAIFHLYEPETTVWIAHPKVEFGTTPTPWSEATEDFDSDLTVLKSSITQNSDQISQLLTKTNLNSDAITSAQNLIKNTADSFNRTLTQTQSDLDKKISKVAQTADGIVSTVEQIGSVDGNMLLESGSGWTNEHQKLFVLAEPIVKGRTYTAATQWWRSDNSTPNIGLDKDETLSGNAQWVNLGWHPENDCWWVTFTATETIPAGKKFWFATSEATGIGSANWATLIQGNKPLYPWKSHWSELGTESTKTQVSQLAGSWAVRNLTNSGTVLNQLNLNKDGTVKIDGKLVHISGETLIDKAVIKSAMVDKLKTANFETGSVTSDIIKAGAVTGDKIKFDQAFFNNLTSNQAYLKQLFSKEAFINQVQSVRISADQINGGHIRSINGATDIDLLNGGVNFLSDSPAIRRSVSGLPNQFVKFSTATESNDNSFRVLASGPSSTTRASTTSIGTNRSNGESTKDGSFTGINIIASGAATGDSVSDRIGIHSDIMIVSHSVPEGQKGWVFENHNRGNNDFAIRPMMPRKNSLYSSFLGTKSHTITRLFVDDIELGGHRLKAILKQLAILTGKSGGWADDFN